MHESFAITILQMKIKETNVDMMAALTFQEEGILCEKVKSYPVLLINNSKVTEKKMMWPIWNGMECALAKEIEIGRFLLFSRKNSKEGVDRTRYAFRTSLNICNGDFLKKIKITAKSH